MKTKRVTRTLVALLVAGGVALVASLWVAPYPITSVDAVRSGWRGSHAWLLDRNGEALSRIRVDHERKRGEWVALADVSPVLVEMVIASEDKRLREHGGVDWRAMAAALRQTLAGERRGGSTLTMQLAAHSNPALEQGGRRNLLQKWRQVRQALAIERHWSKDEILEAWLNLTPFRGELEGVDAASRSLFGKRAGGTRSRSRARCSRRWCARQRRARRVSRGGPVRCSIASSAIASSREGIAAGGLRAWPPRRAISTARRRTSRADS